MSKNIREDFVLIGAVFIILLAVIFLLRVTFDIYTHPLLGGIIMSILSFRILSTNAVEDKK